MSSTLETVMSGISSTKRLPYATLDVFTNDRFEGNPLAIVNIPRSVTLDPKHKQLIAREFNFSETVFLDESENESSPPTVSIFTTTEELPFAGHPTIGTICYICARTSTGSSTQHLTLLTKAGPIAARYDSGKALAEAEIPHNVRLHQCTAPWQYILDSQPSLATALGTDNLPSGRTQYNCGLEASFPIFSIVKGMTFVLVELPHVDDFLTKVRVSHRAIGESVIRLDDGWSPSFAAPYFYVVLPNNNNGTTMIRTRMIEPGIGEDPATGSAACALGAYLALQNGGGNKTYTYSIEQGVEMGRRSQIGVNVTLSDDGLSVRSVLLSGSAVLVTQGQLLL